MDDEDHKKSRPKQVLASRDSQLLKELKVQLSETYATTKPKVSLKKLLKSDVFGQQRNKFFPENRQALARQRADFIKDKRFADLCRKLRSIVEDEDEDEEEETPKWQLRAVARMELAVPQTIKRVKHLTPMLTIKFRLVPLKDSRPPSQPPQRSTPVRVKNSETRRLETTVKPGNRLEAGALKGTDKTCAQSGTVLGLQEVALDQLWSVYQVLTRYCEGTQKKFVDALWLSKGKWTLELEELRAKLFADNVDAIRENWGSRNALGWTEDVFNFNTQLALYRACLICGFKTDLAETPNIEYENFALLADLEYELMSHACKNREKCDGEKQPHALHLELPLPCFVVYGPRRRPSRTISEMLKFVPEQLPLDVDKLYVRYLLNVKEVYDQPKVNPHCFLIKNEGGELLRVDDSTPHTRFEELQRDPGVGGFQTNWAMYVLKRLLKKPKQRLQPRPEAP